MKYTTVGLSDTFQITGRQSDFRPNHSFDVAKLVFSPSPDTLNHEEHVDLTIGLSLKKFLSFGCFDSRYVMFWG